MSAPRIIAQATNWLMASAPNTRQLTLVHLRATIGANGQPTVLADIDATTGDAGTTPAVTLAETADNTAIYDVTFPPCRQVYTGSIHIQIFPDVLATVANHRFAMLDKTDANTAAKLGKFRFTTAEYDAAAGIAVPPTGSEIHLSFWADFG